MAHGHMEVEAKYQIRSDGGGDGYLVAPEIGPFTPAGPVRSTHVEDRYVDTADWALARTGFAARLRRTSRGLAIELKRQATPEGRLHRREELSGPADDTTPPAQWPSSPARSVILELCGNDPLHELLTIAQVRRVRRLQCGATKVDLSVDRVEVRAGSRALDHFEELEAELAGGPEEPLADLVEVFERDAGLRALKRSKFERAVRLVRAALPEMSDEARARWSNAPAQLNPERARPGRRGGRAEKAAGAEAAAGDAAGSETAGETATPETAAANGRPSGAARNDTEVRVGPRTLGVLPDDTLPEAARKVLTYHFARLRSKEKGARNGGDPEDLHDMRVAARRMRAAWKVFDDAFKPARTRRLRRRLRTLSDRLGAVRDLDVLIDELELYRAGLDPEQQAGLDPLHSLWSRQRRSARQLLLDELDSPRHADFLREMEAFLEAGVNEAATVGSPTVPHRVRDRLPSQLWAAYENVRAYELVLPWADVETLHQLRIASKWLRYDLEFFGETLGSEAERLTDRVVGLQDFLGCLHDADVASKLARDILVARAGELTGAERDAIGAYLHLREREVERRRRALGPVWRAVVGAPFRRSLGRATARL